MFLLLATWIAAIASPGPDLFQLIDADLKAIDKALFGTPKKK